MTEAELQQALVSAGIPCQIRRQEVVIQVCVFCSNAKWNLECHAEKGVFHAWCCKRGGRLDKLLKDLTGETYRIAVQKVVKEKQKLAQKEVTDFTSRPISEVGSAQTYLEQRGFTADVVRNYGIVFVDHPGPPQHPLHHRIAVPLRDYWSGDIVGWTGRSYTGKHPKYMTTWQHKVIVGWQQRNQSTPAVIVEGPLDGIAVHRAGYHAAVLTGIGPEGIDEWAARISPDADIVIMLDAEAEAQQQAQRLYWKISAMRRPPLVVPPPPGQDPAGVGPAVIGKMVTEAVRAARPT